MCECGCVYVTVSVSPSLILCVSVCCVALQGCVRGVCEWVCDCV